VETANLRVFTSSLSVAGPVVVHLFSGWPRGFCVPFRAHGTVEFLTGLAFVALPLLTGAQREHRARNHFLARGLRSSPSTG
jgi:hypothetical protein